MNAQELTTLGNMIKALLDYKSCACDRDRWAPCVDILTGDPAGTGLRLANTKNDEKTGRLDIDPIYGNLGQHLPRMEKRPGITVSASKSARQIALDIERRLLPQVRDIIEQAKQSAQRDRDYKQLTEAVAQRLQQASGGGLDLRQADPQSRDDRPRLYVNSTKHPGLYLSADVSGETIHFQHLTLTADQAARMFRALFGKD